MDPTRSLALLLHVTGFIVWIGALVSMAHALVTRDAEKDETVRTRLGALARSEGLRADIGAALAIVGGVWLLSMAFGFYMHQPWMHTKLTLVVLVLGAHGYLRVKAKRAALGQPGAFPGAFLPILWLLAVGIVAMIAFKPGAR